MSFTIVRRTSAALAVLAGLALAGMSGASSAQAAPVPPTKGGGESSAISDTRCVHNFDTGLGDMCFWKNDHAFGSRVGIFNNDTDLADNVFQTPGDGQGTSVKNNAVFYFNYDDHYGAYLYTEENYTGSWMYVPPNDIGTLPAGFVRNVESISWVFVS